MAGGTRARREKRREQIVAAAVSVVADYGVRGATLTRVASALGVTHPALYAYFPTRKDLLMAVLDLLFNRVMATHRQCYRESALDHLREIGLAHSRLVTAPEGEFVFPLFEFIAAAREEGLAEAIAARELLLIDDLIRIAERGQEQGTIDREADTEQLAWMIVGRAWTEDVATLIGLGDLWNQERSGEMLDLLLASVTPGSAPGEQTGPADETGPAGPADA